MIFLMVIIGSLEKSSSETLTEVKDLQKEVFSKRDFWKKIDKTKTKTSVN